MNYWLHRISYEWSVSSVLLKEKNLLSIGFSDFLQDEYFIENINNENGRDYFEKTNKKIWGQLVRNRWSLWRFLTSFKENDIILVPTSGKFSLYKVTGKPTSAGKGLNGTIKDTNGHLVSSRGDYLYRGDQLVDLGYVIPVKPIEVGIPRDGYCDDPLKKRMKIYKTNADMNDYVNNIEEARRNFVSKTPIDIHEIAISGMSDSMLKVIREKMDDRQFEKLIKWYLEKLGALDVNIPAKNEAGKEDGADADVIAAFEKLHIVIYVQAKHHTGTTDGWAVEQIEKYKEQKFRDESDDNSTPLTWVISSADEFAEDAVENAKTNGVRLINGTEFARMLIDVGIDHINDAFLTD